MSHFLRKTKSLQRRLGEVGPRGVWLLAKAFFLLTAAKAALQWIAVKRIVSWKQRPLRRAASGDQAKRCAAVRWAVLTAARYSPVEFVCFPQCLAAAEMLRAAGIASRLHYGVTRQAGQLQTHTWLEAEGKVVIGGEVADAFSTLDVY